MGKVRVYQLAKELNVQSALILELLDLMGKEVKSDLSSLDESTADLVRRRITALIEREKKKLEEERRRRAELEAAQAREAPAATAGAEPEPAAAAPAAPGTDTPAPPAAEHAAQPASGPPAAAAPPAPEPPPPPPPGATRPPRVFPAQRIPTQGQRARSSSTAGRAAPRRPRPAPAPSPPRQETVAEAARRKRKERKEAQERAASAAVPAAAPRAKRDLPPVPAEVTLSEAVTVKELAEKINRKSKDVIAKLLARGVMATINQPLDPELAVEIAKEFGAEARVLTFEEQVAQELQARRAQRAQGEPGEATVPRPPVVTVMGHVDHGKTSLLDRIRATNVAADEHGGITQHIGAYQVEKKGRKITFLDTPGHEAFTMMRARGAKVTDIVVLVVAADDGVKPQTLEALDHARAAGVPMIVAINKIDKPDARPDRVKQQLAEHGVVVEEYGGDTVCVEVSAKTGHGIDDLLEMLLLVADIQELKANPDKPASGVILEAKLDRSRGIVATVLVQDGTLRAGAPFIAGTAFGKVRAMMDENGHRLEAAGPSTPVEVMGFDSEPTAGDIFQVVEDEAKARQIAALRREKLREEALQRSARRISLESLSREIAAGQTAKELPILLKADAQGSLEAVQKALGELPSEKVKLQILRASTGGITQADVLLASASEAIIVGFNVRADRAAEELARQEHVEIRTYTVIYDLISDIKQAMVGMLEPIRRERVLGQAEVRKIFRVPKVGTVAGCYVLEGKAVRNAEVRLIRENVVVYTGKVGSLKRFKDDVSEVAQGFECGVSIANFNDIKENDVLEFFLVEEVAAQTL